MKVKWIQMEDSLRSKPKILESFLESVLFRDFWQEKC